MAGAAHAHRRQVRRDREVAQGDELVATGPLGQEQLLHAQEHLLGIHLREAEGAPPRPEADAERGLSAPWPATSPMTRRMVPSASSIPSKKSPLTEPARVAM